MRSLEAARARWLRWPHRCEQTPGCRSGHSGCRGHSPGVYRALRRSVSDRSRNGLRTAPSGSNVIHDCAQFKKRLFPGPLPERKTSVNRECPCLEEWVRTGDFEDEPFHLVVAFAEPFEGAIAEENEETYGLERFGRIGLGELLLKPQPVGLEDLPVGSRRARSPTRRRLVKRLGTAATANSTRRRLQALLPRLHPRGVVFLGDLHR